MINLGRPSYRTYQELSLGEHAKLLVLGCETGGRWSHDALTILPLLAEARARSAPQLLQKQLQAAMVSRWSATVAVAAQDALACTLSGEGCGGMHFPADRCPQWGDF